MLQPPSSPSPIEEENEEQLSMAFSIQYDVVSSIEQDSFPFRRGKVTPPRITSDSDSSRNEAPSMRRFEEPVSENAVFSAEFSSHFEEPAKWSTTSLQNRPRSSDVTFNLTYNVKHPLTCCFWGPLT